MLPFSERCRIERALILDGATGTELARRGVDITGPSWTAAAITEYPSVLTQIHSDYVTAGAEIITANTFRTHARNLGAIGQAGRSRELTKQAVQIARAAAGGRAYVAGSAAPLGDCYTPGETPDELLLLGEHRQHAENLAQAGVDLILVETQVTLREAVAAARAAVETGLPVFASYVCRGDGRLFSGESLNEGLQALQEWSPTALLVNCVPAEEIEGLLPTLKKFAPQHLIGAYANTGRLHADGTWSNTAAVEPAVYAELAARWVSEGLSVVGGCCGTTPAHISELRNRICGER